MKFLRFVFIHAHVVTLLLHKHLPMSVSPYLPISYIYIYIYIYIVIDIKMANAWINTSVILVHRFSMEGNYLSLPNRNHFDIFKSGDCSDGTMLKVDYNRWSIMMLQTYGICEVSHNWKYLCIRTYFKMNRCSKRILYFWDLFIPLLHTCMFPACCFRQGTFSNLLVYYVFWLGFDTRPYKWAPNKTRTRSCRFVVECFFRFCIGLYRGHYFLLDSLLPPSQYVSPSLPFGFICISSISFWYLICYKVFHFLTQGHCGYLCLCVCVCVCVVDIL